MEQKPLQQPVSPGLGSIPQPKAGPSARPKTASGSMGEPKHTPNTHNIERELGVNSLKRPNMSRLRLLLTGLVIILILAMLAPLIYVGWQFISKDSATSNSQQDSNQVVTSIPLSDLIKDGDISTDANRRVNINGQLRANNTFVLAPSDTPTNPVIGQVYLNQQNTQLYYYNGSQFVDLVGGDQLTQITDQLNQTEALATQLQSQSTAGGINGSGTVGRLAKFAANQALADSLLSESASTITAGGDLSVSGVVSGNGSGLTSLSATNISSGTLADARLSNNVALLDRDNQTFTGSTQIFRNDTNSSTAFQIQNAASQSLLQVDTLSNVITLGGNNSGEIEAWTTLPDLPGNVNGSNAVVVNGYVYLAGNRLSDGATYSAKLNADGSIAGWNTTSSLSTAVNFGAPVASNGYVYVTGGQNSGGTKISTVQYAKINNDGTLGSWGTTTALPDARVEHVSTVANGYIYVIGGVDNSLNQQTTAYYAKLNPDGTVGSWSTTTSVPALGLESAASFTANGHIYVIGGKNISGIGPCSSLCTNAIYYAKFNSDGTLGSWSTGNSTNLPLMTHARSVLMNGYIYAISGSFGQGNDVSDAVYYSKLNPDGTNGAWVQSSSSLPAPRHAPAVAAVNGYIYSFGGGGTATSVLRSSGQRLRVAGALDLVGISGDSLAGQTGNPGGGSAGGSLTAGDTRVVGLLDVTGQTNLGSSLNVYGSTTLRGGAILQNAVDSTKALQVQNAAGTALLTADTTNMTVTVQALTVAANLILNGHLVTGGSTPSTAVNANAGVGATCTVSGTDTAGTITVTTGSSGVVAGTQCTVSFSSSFGAAPRVVVGPSNSAAGPLDPYIGSTATNNFTVGVGTAGSTTTVYKFDYVAAQ